MAVAVGAARRAAFEALVAAEERVGRARAELTDAEADAVVLRRKLRLEVGKQWADLDFADDGPPQGDPSTVYRPTNIFGSYSDRVTVGPCAGSIIA